MGKGRGRPVGCQVGVRDCEGVSLGREGVAFWQMGLKLDKLHFSPEPKMGKVFKLAYSSKLANNSTLILHLKNSASA